MALNLILDLPQRGLDDGHWDQKNNACLLALQDAVNALSEAVDDSSAEVSNALSGVSSALATVQSAEDAADQAVADVATLTSTVNGLAVTVDNLDDLVGGVGTFPRIMVGDVARPTADVNVRVIWIHNVQPAAMLNNDILLNLPA